MKNADTTNLEANEEATVSSADLLGWLRGKLADAERILAAHEQAIPCPFCPLRLPAPAAAEKLSGGIWKVECKHCGASGPRCGTKEIAEKWWNDISKKAIKANQNLPKTDQDLITPFGKYKGYLLSEHDRQ